MVVRMWMAETILRQSRGMKGALTMALAIGVIIRPLLCALPQT